MGFQLQAGMLGSAFVCLCCVFGRIIRLRATPGRSTASEDKANYSVVCNDRQKKNENKTASVDLT